MQHFGAPPPISRRLGELRSVVVVVSQNKFALFPLFSKGGARVGCFCASAGWWAGGLPRRTRPACFPHRGLGAAIGWRGGWWRGGWRGLVASRASPSLLICSKTLACHRPNRPRDLARSPRALAFCGEATGESHWLDSRPCQATSERGRCGSELVGIARPWSRSHLPKSRSVQFLREQTTDYI